jgi:glycosyltransferase involved in cell wall biosynthesis
LKTPFFSIVVPTFNRAYILKQCIDSVKDQIFEDWELLIVDDGSSDETENLVMMEQALDSRIRFFQREMNSIKGPSTCRNIGIENVKGKYIAFLDSDDFWRKDRLENINHFIQKRNAQAIYSGAWVKGRKGEFFRHSRPINPNERWFDFILKSDSFIPTPSLVIDSKIVRTIRFNTNLKNHEDYDFFLRISELCDWVFYEGQEVVIDWKDNDSRQINYENCLWFYRNYKIQSKEKKARIDYLRFMAQDMVSKNPPHTFLREYYSLLKEEEYEFKKKDILMFNFPGLYRKLLKFK